MPAKPKHPGGRPPKIDLKKLKSLMRLRPSLSDAAEILDVGERTVEETIQREYGMSFRDFRNKSMANTRMSLVQNALKYGNQGNTALLIFALKNLCGWSDQGFQDEVDDIDELEFSP